jgi:uracil-DNA glycosylase family 4
MCGAGNSQPGPTVRAIAFSALVELVAACRRCPAMEGRRRVLSELNGPIDARVLFVAEAPGRLGAERSGIPLTSDQSGRNFTRLLAVAGVDREDIFVTNGVLCNPRDERGLNRSPTPFELANCAPHLASQLQIIRAPIVVALGVTALRALDRIEPHGLLLRESVARAVPWHGRLLLPLYHPGPQAMLHRGFAQQSEDYQVLGRLLANRSR